MSTINYNPAKDELRWQRHPIKGKPKKDFGWLKLWWDKDHGISAIALSPYTVELVELERNLNSVKLGGIWRGKKITDRDLRQARKELLQKLEADW